MTPAKYQIGDRFLYHLPALKVAYEGIILDVELRRHYGWCYAVSFKNSNMTVSEKDIDSWYKVRSA